ncbi:putative gamma-glutamylcyclotransferase CG2811 [Nilaparvata lugens]|uniref:putative gamma-glutamylcyclotransferase CG2811 n=1 Tax=Nilaparvata lugens TaxID=108931 RepID=UPI00193DBDA8|nr:putative gamma-glutamylcyclotransferase CG2811 [Nilaparvata lugens]
MVGMSSEEMEASHLNHLLFVYGTLKQGEPNQDVIKTENKIDGKEQPQSQFINVTGEIYEINDKMLEKLDIFEECPEYYIRRKECVRLLDTQKTAECWIYFLKGHHPNLIKLEMFNNYCSNGEHGLPYLER